MKFVLLALSMLLCAACEKKPTEEEVRQKADSEKAAAEVKASPKPKPGEWMWKDRQNPLEKKKAH